MQYILAFTFFIMYSIALRADAFLFSEYNDFFAGTDKHFTSGTLLAWLENPKEEDDFTNIVVNMIPFNLQADKHYSAGVSLAQFIITPQDTMQEDPQYDDLPYAGYLALSSYLFIYDTTTFTEYSLEFGVVGEEAGAEFVQKQTHKVIGSNIPKGWSTQLPTQYIVNFFWHQGEKSYVKNFSSGYSMDWFNHYGVMCGLFEVSAFGGSALRIGKNYTVNFNAHYPYLKDEATLLIDTRHNNSFGWSISGGINSEILAYSYILDKGKSLGYDTDKNIVNFALYIGWDLYYKRNKMSFFYQAPSPYVKNQRQENVFGGFIYSHNF